MRSRQDQLHAYQYSMQRVVAALVSHDPDPARSPLTRTGLTVLAGLLVAAIALGATFAYAAITGRSSARDLRNETAVFIEKETGAQYVYTSADDKLHPVINYTSGLLIAKSDKANPITIRRSGLAKQQQRGKLQLGSTLGIPDAPKSLPPQADLIRDPWRLCTRVPAGAATRPSSVLSIGGQEITGGRPLAAPAPATASEALLVADSSGSTYLVYANHKFLIRKPAAALAAFGWTGRRPIPVTAAWINAIPTGVDVQPLRIDGLRQKSAELGKTVGQLYRAPGQGSAFQWSVLQRDGVLPITEVQARLLDADPATRIAPPLTISAAEFGALPQTGAPPAQNGQDLLPSTVPNLVNASRAVCATVTDASTGVTAIVVDPDVPADPVTSGGSAATTASSAPSATADRIRVPFGRGALVEPAPSADAPAGSNLPTLITDAGLRFPIADRDALSRLGYGNTFAPRMPAELVALVPQGPALSTQEALKPRA